MTRHRQAESATPSRSPRSDIVPGGVFPDYALPDHTGVVRTLSELQGRDPLILTLDIQEYTDPEHDRAATSEVRPD